MRTPIFEQDVFAMSNNEYDGHSPDKETLSIPLFKI
jgi:hypothetical protein